ncbi:DUF2510 domain-containing protein [Nocardia farcinica]|uniref:DUF2510 domain-containing protein n=1 Tax=Nocardia farcinica TaxID=37329 RepID=UPI003416B454
MTTQPPPGQQPPAAPPPGRRRTNAVILGVVGAVLAVVLLIVIIGAVAGGGEGDQAAATTTPPAGPSPAASLTTPRPAAGPTPSDPRCAPAAPNVTALVQAGLSTAGYQLSNGTVITEGGLTYFGATIVDADGARKSRSDVWVLRDGAVYASTGGARRESIFPHADAVGVGPGDAPVQAVDNCVVNATR